MSTIVRQNFDNDHTEKALNVSFDNSNYNRKPHDSCTTKNVIMHL